jgi:hypothetical protein
VEALVALIEDGDAEDVRGQEVRRELHALEAGADGARQRLGQRGLPGARVVVEQDVAARGEGGEELADGARLPLHHPPDAVGEPSASLLRRERLRVVHVRG